MTTTARRLLVVLALAGVALGLLSPAARADGDPGSDVLVYQNLFVAADAGLPVAQQVQLGNLLAGAASSGLPVRVAVIAQPDDLGAVTALWDRPAAYANFLGIELSLAYTGRLLVVMPDGFGLYWHGHSVAAADQVLAGLPVGAGGAGLGTAAQRAVRALAAAADVRIAAAGTPGAAGAAAATGSAATPAGGGAAGGASLDMTLLLVMALVTFAACLASIVLAWRVGVRLRWPLAARAARSLLGLARGAGRLARRPALSGNWAAGGFVGLACLLLAAYAGFHVLSAAGPAGASQGAAQSASALAQNASLDPGASLTGTAPGFTLTDQFGQPVSLSSYRGKAVILAFNDPECTTVCPLTTAALADAKAMLGAAGSQVQLLGVDANPKATSVEDVVSYSQLHGMLYQWRYLTGSLTQLLGVWKAYSVGVTISASQIDHQPAIFVITPQGRLAKLYLTQMAYSAVTQFGQLLAQEVASVLPGHPAVDSRLSYSQVSAVTPATLYPLPAESGGYLSLGPGRPRLSVFFATWDREVTPLGGQLDALNAYQAAAGKAGLPALTAVDEGSVEPSASALPQFLAALPQPLSYPVGIDGSGRLADGYGVQGQPWFVLTSASGEVLWSWEVSTSGWLTQAQLRAHVRAALAAA
jgi:cytochrome oxidase Cu insertion factor (SCO1/SenC/PrrC family)